MEAIYSAISECQKLYPDPEMSDSEEDDMEDREEDEEEEAEEEEEEEGNVIQ